MTPGQEETLGNIIGRLVKGEPRPGPPWTHTIRQPEPVQDENGDWYTPLEPTHTLRAYTCPEFPAGQTPAERVKAILDAAGFGTEGR